MRKTTLALALVAAGLTGAAWAGDIPQECTNLDAIQNPALKHNCELMFRAIKVENGVNGVVDTSKTVAASAWEKTKQLGAAVKEKGGQAIEAAKEHLDKDKK